ncbi:hypothetical protein EHS25_002746 [Saitozyma podzolica]|uniref:Uncharacterized protein n=1 Tax=Saitozyma podzolica TaxID=1890683 RepID=A0A427YD76_9TREE|nr:hypothetical protein EHS25_002746 [Saitozyma podzolica]
MRAPRRLLATLSPTTPSVAPSSLLPPYTHSLPTSATTTSSSSSSRLRPPYAHSVSPLSPALRAPMRYALLRENASANDPTSVADSAWVTWAEGLLGSESGRREVRDKWVEAIVGLEKIKSVGVRPGPQISFHSLASHLDVGSTIQAILASGSVIVRDVVLDAEASKWAAEIVRATNEREGNPVFWHPSLLAARAHPSVLSSNKQLLSALAANTGVGVNVNVDGTADPFVLAEAVQEGFESDEPRGIDLENNWVPVSPSSSTPNTPLLAHLALTPSLSYLLPTSHSAIYAALRPLFRPVRSRLSFYHPSAYLDPTNWVLLSPGEVVTPHPSAFASHSDVDASANNTPADVAGSDLPHLDGTFSRIELEAGDMLYRHPSVPARASSRVGESGLSLPISPIPAEGHGAAAYVRSQREAFEAGSPPPGYASRLGGVAALEAAGARDAIGGNGGKRAMGY